MNKPRYRTKISPPPSQACCGKDMNPGLLVLLVAILWASAGMFGCLLAEYCS